MRVTLVLLRLQGGHEIKCLTANSHAACYHRPKTCHVKLTSPPRLVSVWKVDAVRRLLKCLILRNGDAITHYAVIHFPLMQVEDTVETTHHFLV